MAQYLKDSVREGILRASLLVFSKKGYAGTTMAEIAAEATISVGNIYRYFGNKGELYDAVITEEFVKEFGESIRGRVAALGNTREIGSLEATSLYHLMSEKSLAFSIENRLRIVVLLRRSEGTRRQGYRAEMVEQLVQMALQYGERLRIGFEATEIAVANLRMIYENYLDGLCAILYRYENEESIRRAVAGYSGYHLAGMKAFFELR
jgi:AcrR family transcriptional regulator